MPYSSQWVEPELFVSHNGVKVYHVYINDDVASGVSEFGFTTNELEGEGSESEFAILDFDLDDKFYGEGVMDAVHRGDCEAKRTLIRAAIDAGLLPLCDRKAMPTLKHNGAETAQINLKNKKTYTRFVVIRIEIEVDASHINQDENPDHRIDEIDALVVGELDYAVTFDGKLDFAIDDFDSVAVPVNIVDTELVGLLDKDPTC